MHIAILGIGEVGKKLAADFLRSGVTVSGWDPQPIQIPEGVHFAASNPDAAKNADLILSTNLASVAIEVAVEVGPSLQIGQVYADMNTTSPATKRQIDRLFQDRAARFADVAIMSPILPGGIHTRMLASGNGAAAFSQLLSPYGTAISVLDAPAGQAATQKLLRSIFYKGVAAVVLETIEAAQRLNLEEWALDQILSVLPDSATVERFISGSKKHASRRIDEMEAVIELLDELGVSAHTSYAAQKRLVELASDTRSP